MPIYNYFISRSISLRHGFASCFNTDPQFTAPNRLWPLTHQKKRFLQQSLLTQRLPLLNLLLLELAIVRLCSLKVLDLLIAAIAKLNPQLYKPAIKLKCNPNWRRRLRYG